MWATPLKLLPEICKIFNLLQRTYTIHFANRPSDQTSSSTSSHPPTSAHNNVGSLNEQIQIKLCVNSICEFPFHSIAAFCSSIIIAEAPHHQWQISSACIELWRRWRRGWKSEVAFRGFLDAVHSHIEYVSMVVNTSLELVRRRRSVLAERWRKRT